jgi:hypothetical protein
MVLLLLLLLLLLSWMLNEDIIDPIPPSLFWFPSLLPLPSTDEAAAEEPSISCCTFNRRSKSVSVASLIIDWISRRRFVANAAAAAASEEQVGEDGDGGGDDDVAPLPPAAAAAAAAVKLSPRRSVGAMFILLVFSSSWLILLLMCLPPIWYFCRDDDEVEMVGGDWWIEMIDADAWDDAMATPNYLRGCYYLLLVC